MNKTEGDLEMNEIPSKLAPNPWWVRLIFWRADLFWMDKRYEALLFEGFIVLIALGFFAGAIIQQDSVLLGFSLACALCSYVWSVIVRLSDRYSMWKDAT